jgi:esterase/lipase superfamily enzyme
VDTQFVDESDNHARVVDLAFVTNRRLVDTREGERYYSDKPGALSAGRRRVGFEEGSRRGEVLRVNTVAIESVIPPGDKGRVVVYIHGYGESFERNCRRGALLKDRLQLGDRLLLFSWPASNYLTYAQDIDDLAASLGQLNELLSELLQHVDAEDIVLMAHSLGSRGLVDALRQRDEGESKFSEAVFVAPDIRRDVFMENVSMLQEKVSDITVYMSDNDRVLWISATVNTSGRLGLAKEFDVDIDRISVVDVTPTGTNDISGHMYHMFNPAVVEDLRVLFGVPLEGDSRKYGRVAMATPGFWSLEPVTHDK